jgi:dienelactone hydrolase
VPFMVLLHGCGSANGPQPAYAKALVAAGIACLIVDSHAPRKISRMEAVTRVCSGTMLWGREQAGDLLALFEWARHQPWVDATKLGAAGWSHGGWTIMDALALGREIGRHAGLSDVPDDPLAGLSHVSLVYPWSGPGSHTFLRGWTRSCPGIMVLAEKDSVAGTLLPKQALARARRSGAAIDLHVFSGATHSFDEESSLNPTFKYNPEQCAEAVNLVCDRAVYDLGL